MIPIHLNGELREVPENLTLTALLEWLKLPADRVAVERNRLVTPRSAWRATIILPNDQLEVVHFVGGGVDVDSQASPTARGKRCNRCRQARRT